ncbi:hypothetical protein [Nocardioides sp. SYSU DS0651]|uniref:hypothetical protein n=1 Tax=Nocardioides sp. SYSU DS0651 TaxID=3415955 RepID=UPI003F4B2E05
MSDTERDALPIPDYDHLPTGSLGSRIRSLDKAGLEALIGYEQSHGDRAPVLQVLRQRLEELESGAEPTGGDPEGDTLHDVRDDASPEPKARPETTGPPINPPSQGVPTNPAQPRR